MQTHQKQCLIRYHQIMDKRSKFIITLVSVVIAAFLQAYVLNVFIQPTNLLSSGFTGVAILIEKITSL